jgi:hypothetical protein
MKRPLEEACDKKEKSQRKKVKIAGPEVGKKQAEKSVVFAF